MGWISIELTLLIQIKINRTLLKLGEQNFPKLVIKLCSQQLNYNFKINKIGDNHILHANILAIKKQFKPDEAYDLMIFLA